MGLVARSRGIGKDRHPVVYRQLPSSDAAIDRRHLEELFNALPRRSDGYVYLSDVADAVSQIGLPSVIVPDTINEFTKSTLIKKSNTGLIEGNEGTISKNPDSFNSIAMPKLPGVDIDRQLLVPLDLDTFIAIVGRKDNQLRSLFNTFDTTRSGRIHKSDVERAMHAANLVTTSNDDRLLNAIADRAERAGEAVGFHWLTWQLYLLLSSGRPCFI